MERLLVLFGLEVDGSHLEDLDQPIEEVGVVPKIRGANFILRLFLKFAPWVSHLERPLLGLIVTRVASELKGWGVFIYLGAWGH